MTYTMTSCVKIVTGMDSQLIAYENPSPTDVRLVTTRSIRAMELLMLLMLASFLEKSSNSFETASGMDGLELYNRRIIIVEWALSIRRFSKSDNG